MNSPGFSISLLTQHYERHRHQWKGSKILNFKFTNQVMLNHVTRAVLNVHVQDQSSRTHYLDPHGTNQLTIQVSKMFRSGSVRASVIQGSLNIEISNVDLSSGSWYQINVTELVSGWFRMPRDNLGVIIKVFDTSGRYSVSVPQTRLETNQNLMPYLEIYLKDNTRKRIRRTVSMDCNEESKETRCCRYPLKVDFEQFGWDWIIAPKQYEANYCRGECPYAFFQKYPHTHIVHLASPPGSIGPCCSPRKMSSISMLFFDHEFNIIYGTLPGMVVETCGCA